MEYSSLVPKIPNRSTPLKYPKPSIGNRQNYLSNQKLRLKPSKPLNFNARRSNHNSDSGVLANQNQDINSSFQRSSTKSPRTLHTATSSTSTTSAAPIIPIAGRKTKANGNGYKSLATPETFSPMTSSSRPVGGKVGRGKLSPGRVGGGVGSRRPATDHSGRWGDRSVGRTVGGGAQQSKSFMNRRGAGEVSHGDEEAFEDKMKNLRKKFDRQYQNSKGIKKYDFQHEMASRKKVPLFHKKKRFPNRIGVKGTVPSHVVSNKSPKPKRDDVEVKLEEALLELSEMKTHFYKEKDSLDNQLQRVKVGISSNPDLKAYLDDGSVPRSPRTEDLKSNLAGNMSPRSDLSPTYTDHSFPDNPSTMARELREVKDKLNVAENIMKSLYRKNKKLQHDMTKMKESTFATGPSPTSFVSSVNPVKLSFGDSEIYQNTAASEDATAASRTGAPILGDKDGYIQVEEEEYENLMEEVRAKGETINELNSKIQKMHNDLELMNQQPESLKKYIEFLEKTLSSSQEDSRRHLANYAKAREAYFTILKKKISSLAVYNKGSSSLQDFLGRVEKTLTTEVQTLSDEHTLHNSRMQLSEQKYQHEVKEKALMATELEALKRELKKREEVETKIEDGVQKLIARDQELREENEVLRHQLALDESDEAQSLIEEYDRKSDDIQRSISVDKS
mmetsp:Transcript_40098/g.45816  ORF Transcript_40098/g.45816 Transcript_40098/m.45816 type:complete len:675 (-) Transcript_40098:161-2185(-)